MEKRAKTDYPIHDVLARRWSPVAFSERPIEKKDLLALFEAARWAPSSFGDQPWSYIVTRKHEDKDAYERLLSCLVAGNQVWAKAAPVLALSVARMTFAHNGEANSHAWHDVGAASMSLCVQATAQGLVVHQMAGFEADRARALFRIPEGFEPVAAMAIGYPGDPQSLPEKSRARELAPRNRHHVEEFLFTDSWGRRAGVLKKSTPAPRLWGSPLLLPHWG